MAGGKIQHWKHGWIPLSPEARAFVAGRGPRPTTSRAGGGPRLALLALPDRSLKVRQYDDLPPKLQKRIAARLEAATGIPEPELAKRVQANLRRFYEQANKTHADWYPEAKVDIARRAMALGPPIDADRLTGMIAVTSAKKRWVENVSFAERVAQKVVADEPFDVTDEMVDDYNRWVSKRKNPGRAKPHPELRPGRFRPSELPADFVASKTPGMPKMLNTDAVIAAVQISRGEATADDTIQGPKQRSFVNNLTDPTDPRSVTVDTWHYRAMMAGIPVTRDYNGRDYTYTLEQWQDRELSVADGRAADKGFDPSLPRYDDRNIDATIKAADNLGPQAHFQSGPASKPDNYDGNYGTYPWFVKQTQAVADDLGVSPNSLQAIAWYEIGGGK